MNNCQLSKEFSFLRYKNGIKLVSPQRAEPELNVGHALQGRSLGLSVAEVLMLPQNVYFINTQSQMQIINEHCAMTMGFTSPKASYGKSMYDISPYSNAKSVIDTDLEVLQFHHLKIAEDTVTFTNGRNDLQFISFKAPWYNEKNELSGIFGCSILYDKPSFAESLMNVTRLGLLETPVNLATDQAVQDILKDGYYLTQRELQILRYIVRGMTAKQMAKHLNRSQRTIENHISNIKSKMNVTTKSDLIQKALDLNVKELL